MFYWNIIRKLFAIKRENKKLQKALQRLSYNFLIIKTENEKLKIQNNNLLNEINFLRMN